MALARSVVAVGIAAVFSAAAGADIAYTSQNREVFAGTGFGGLDLSQTLTAPDFGPWVETVTVDGSGGTDPGGGVARQDSRLDPGQISVIASASADDGPMTGVGAARSTASIVFSLAAASDFRLEGSWSVAGQPGQSTNKAFARLTSGGTTIYESAYSASSGPASAMFDITGTLGPGSYLFEVEADTRSFLSPGFGASSAQSTAVLTVPSPAGLLVLGSMFAVRRRR